MPPTQPQQLKQLLVSGDIVSSTLNDAIRLCDDWYAAEPSLAPFGLLSLFRDLASRDWDDPQGVAADVYEPFKTTVLPHLVKIADLLSNLPSATPTAELDDLAIAYCDSLKATP